MDEKGADSDSVYHLTGETKAGSSSCSWCSDWLLPAHGAALGQGSQNVSVPAPKEVAMVEERELEAQALSTFHHFYLLTVIW